MRRTLRSRAGDEQTKMALALTVYAVAYLNTAMRLGLALASRDSKLATAARQAGGESGCR